jgi:transposase-like protein
MEAYVNGVSTRKVDRLVEQLGISSMSKDRVSALCRELDERVEAFRNRPLDGAFPYLWLDAKHLKVKRPRQCALQGAGDRLRRARERLPGGDRVREIFNATDAEAARERFGSVLERFRGTVPKVAELLGRPRRTCSPSAPSRRRTGRSCDRPIRLERVNREVGRRSDIVGIFPNDASALRLAGTLLIEQNDEWLAATSRRSRAPWSSRTGAMKSERRRQRYKPHEADRRVVTPLPPT